jgi:hypothetical protein
LTSRRPYVPQAVIRLAAQILGLAAERVGIARLLARLNRVPTTRIGITRDSTRGALTSSKPLRSRTFAARRKANALRAAHRARRRVKGSPLVPLIRSRRNGLGEKDLRPGSAALEKINGSLR